MGLINKGDMVCFVPVGFGEELTASISPSSEQTANAGPTLETSAIHISTGEVCKNLQQKKR